ncbi:hypothetical protein CTZ27_06175 [Streptomyces griseocarneus]|nr:hypothetical protein CTZ27_06175 [Streptomyces griseocarneus]
MAVEAVIKPNLAGKEHIAAVAAMLVLCAADELRRRRKPRRDAYSGTGSDTGPDDGQRSGAPARRS